MVCGMNLYLCIYVCGVSLYVCMMSDIYGGWCVWCVFDCGLCVYMWSVVVVFVCGVCVYVWCLCVCMHKWCVVCVMCVYMLCMYVCEVYEYVCSSYRKNGRSTSRHKLLLLSFPYNCDYISKNKKGILRVSKGSYWSFLLLNCGGWNISHGAGIWSERILSTYGVMAAVLQRKHWVLSRGRTWGLWRLEKSLHFRQKGKG